MPTWAEEHLERVRQLGWAEAWAETWDKAWAEGWAKGWAEGLAESRAQEIAEYLLRVLASQGIHVDDQVRQRILSCTDMATLNLWFDRALKATRLSEVLDDLAQ